MTTLNLPASAPVDHAMPGRGARTMPALVQRRAPQPVAEAPKRQAVTPDQAAERARIQTVLAIVVGVLIAATGLALFMLPLDLVALGAVGITLTVLLFGLPFWISAIDEAASSAGARARAEKSDGEFRDCI